MSATTSIRDSGSGMAAEVREAIDAVKLPEVQDLIRQLAKYKLGVCVPHMHTAEQDFAALPRDMVQIEQNCRVRWEYVKGDDTEATAVAVGWRWIDGSSQPHMECWKICVKNDKGDHYERCMK